MEHFSYQGGCGRHRLCVSSHLKEDLTWAIDKWLQVISTIMLFKNSKSSKELKNKAVLHIACIAMWPLVMYSN